MPPVRRKEAKSKAIRGCDHVACRRRRTAMSAPQAMASHFKGVRPPPSSRPGWPRQRDGDLQQSGPHVVGGTPYPGGEWCAEYRGDARILNALLADFAKLEVKTKQVFVYDGVGESFWLSPRGAPAKEAAARIDWSFTVWQPSKWQVALALPGEFRTVDPREADDGPPARFIVYTGGNIRWPDVASRTCLRRQPVGSPRIHAGGRRRAGREGRRSGHTAASRRANSTRARRVAARRRASLR